MLRPKFRRNVLRIIPFGLIWLIASIIYTLLEKGLLAGLRHYPSTGNPYDFGKNMLITPVFALVAGIVFGSLEIFCFNGVFSKRSFGRKILYKTVVSLTAIIFFLILLTAMANMAELRAGFFDKAVWRNILAFCSTYAFFSVSLYIASIVLLSQLYTEISENIGQTVLLNFFTGKYHRPAEEERIFMFLDMKSSTTIAENLGHFRYFEMLKAYYADLSDPVIRYSGEIYQYVGDEMVVSWTLKNGLRNNNCIRCFLDMKTALKAQKEKYAAAFGLLPEFKAGFHVGKVTTGEIGVIKKDIIFTGDVLNTTARIQSLCNIFKVDILLSGDLVKRLEPGLFFPVQSLGEKELRGRDERVEIFTINVAG